MIKREYKYYLIFLLLLAFVFNLYINLSYLTKKVELKNNLQEVKIIPSTYKKDIIKLKYGDVVKELEKYEGFELIKIEQDNNELLKCEVKFEGNLEILIKDLNMLKSNKISAEIGSIDINEVNNSYIKALMKLDINKTIVNLRMK